MTVYVDDSGIQATVTNTATGRRHTSRWSHLFCDGDLAELHRFAARIGMRRAWFQDWPAHRFPHYDVTAPKRLAAVRAGAVEVTSRASVGILRDAFPGEQYRALRLAAEQRGGAACASS